MGLTGVSSTPGVGSVSFVINATFALTSPGAINVSGGSLDPTEEIVGVSSSAITSAVGSLSPADVIGLTGVSATFNVGSVNIAANPVINVTGQAATSSVGSISPADVMGLTGVSTTSAVAGFGTATGFGIQAYSDVDTGSNTSYTNVA